MSNTILHQFLYRSWTVSIRLDRTDSHGPVVGQTDLRFGDEHAHRIVVDEPYTDGSSALRQAAQHARQMVDQWETQPAGSQQPAPAHH
jgi:hypothetical protein